MSDLSWFTIFSIILLLMVGVSSWMAWFSRRAMKSHKGQIEDMIREMRETIDEEEKDEAGEKD